MSEECDVGELDCPCGDAMQCEGGLECIGNLCRDPQGTGGTSSDPVTTEPTTESSTSPQTSDTPVTGETGIATTSGSISSTTGGATSTGADTSSVCAFGSCSECYTCAMADEGPCGMQADVCEMDVMMVPPVCFSIIYGFQMCEPNPGCTECPMATDADGMELVSCLAAECGVLDCKCV